MLISVVLACIGGCNFPSPIAPKVYRIPPNTSYSPIMAWEIGKVKDKENGPVPDPTPSPKVKVGDDCPPPCEGGWTFGDGANKQVCWRCKGDGKADEGDPILDPVNYPSQERVVDSPTTTKQNDNLLTNNVADTLPSTRKNMDTTTKKEVIEEEKRVSSYYIIDNNVRFDWNGTIFYNSVRGGIAPDQKDFNPDNKTHVKVCEGNYCKILPIYKENHTNGTSTSQRPTDGNSKNKEPNSSS